MDANKRLVVEEDLKSLISYGGKLAGIFHQYALTANKLPHGFEGVTNILDATTTTLSQILTLFKDEAENLRNGTGKEYFSSDGISYVKQLVEECAKTLAKVEPTIVDACLSRKEFRVKAKSDKKTLAKKGEVNVVYSELKLDEKGFLDAIEKTNWDLVGDVVMNAMDRLYDLELRLLLVYQVVTIGALSKDMSTGKVDVKSIVTFYERVNRTAKLVDIKTQKIRGRKNRYSSSDSDIFNSDSDSDSDASRVSFRRGSARPPPPPPLRWPNPPHPRIILPPPVIQNIPNGSQSAHPAPAPVPLGGLNPPSYSENHKPMNVATNSTLLTTPSEKDAPSTSSFPAEKIEHEENAVKEPEIDDKLVTLEPRLFRTKPNGLRFKIKSLFRSKESLAAEMRKALCDTDSRLLAFVIEGQNQRLVPHSAFHTLETTHMRTILSQLNDKTWYKTFTLLDQVEQSTLHCIMYPYANGKTHERQMVVLKAIKEENKLTAWVALLRNSRNKSNFGRPVGCGRVLLVILREQVVDGQPLIPNSVLNLKSSPPPFPERGPLHYSKYPPPPGQVRTILPLFQPPPPPFLPVPRGGDMTVPGLGSPTSPPITRPQFPIPGPSGRVGDHLPPGPYHNTHVLGAPGAKVGSIRISDITILNDYEATVALTTYKEYTIRRCESLQPHIPRSWMRVASTLECAEQQAIKDRVSQFQCEGGNVIQAKMHLTVEQSDQVTRLTDELRSAELDNRFEWCCVEISLFDGVGEIKDFALNGRNHLASRAIMIHLIVKRSLKPHCRPLEVYHTMMRATNPPAFEARPPPRFISPPPVIIRNRRCSDSESDRSWYSSDNSIGVVRSRMRRLRTKRSGRINQRSIYYSDSEDSEADDATKLDLRVKRGDDLVKRLLEMWTPLEKGKEKEKFSD